MYNRKLEQKCGELLRDSHPGIKQIIDDYFLEIFAIGQHKAEQNVELKVLTLLGKPKCKCCESENVGEENDLLYCYDCGYYHND